MADIRSLLRQELAARGADSPSAQPTRIPSHIKKRKLDRPPQPDLRKKMKSQTAQPPADSQSSLEQERFHTEDSATMMSSTDGGNAADETPSASGLPATAYTEDDNTVSGARPSVPNSESAGPQAVAEPGDPQRQSPLQPPPLGPAGPVPASNEQSINEDEWAVFERDVVEPSKNDIATFDDATATISAAPISAEQLEKEQSAKERQKQIREAEEGQREDAERFLENEFDEMEGLNERLQRLKDKREEIKKNSLANTQQTTVAAPAPEQTAQAEPVNEEEEEDDDEEEEDDNWLWRAR